MIWWHRAVLGHDTITHLRVPIAWYPGDVIPPYGDRSYVLIQCSCGKVWRR